MFSLIMSWKHVVVFLCCSTLHIFTSFPDEYGYILYCPCIGEFGNQAQHLLDALAFAKGLNRTLVVPPWVIYTKPNVSILIPYETWFCLRHLQNLHKVVSMEYFMKEIAAQLWPEHNRTGYCRFFDENSENKCEMDKGNPIGTFWLDQNITFTEYKLHPLDGWDTVNNLIARHRWQTHYPPSNDSVLAFRRPPGRNIRSTSEIEKSQQSMRFSSELLKQADKKRQRLNMPFRNLVAVQILSKTYLDYICSFNTSYNHGEFFSVSQCTGLNSAVKNRLKFTYKACNPDADIIIDHISVVINETNSTGVFVSTDNVDYHVLQVKSKLEVLFDNKVEIFVQQSYGYGEHEELMTDLVIMSQANFFIGNCIDAYSSFIRRERQIWNRPFSFFGNDTLSRLEEG